VFYEFDKDSRFLSITSHLCQVTVNEHKLFPLQFCKIFLFQIACKTTSLGRVKSFVQIFAKLTVSRGRIDVFTFHFNFTGVHLFLYIYTILTFSLKCSQFGLFPLTKLCHLFFTHLEILTFFLTLQMFFPLEIATFPQNWGGKSQLPFLMFFFMWRKQASIWLYCLLLVQINK